MPPLSPSGAVLASNSETVLLRYRDWFALVRQHLAVGYGVAVVTQVLIFPVFGTHTTLAQSLKLGVGFTVLSVARFYVL